MKEMDEYFKKYFDYINSSEWLQKRKYIAKQRNFICQMCGKKLNKSYHVHHLTYENLCNEKDEDLMLLCKQCHEIIHHRSQKQTEEVSIKKEVLMSNAFLSVGYPAKVLYLYMKAWANGGKTICYSYRLAAKIFSSHSTIIKAFRELETNGLIEIDRESGRKNIITFKDV